MEHTKAQITPHKAVLVNEVLEYLNPQPHKVYLDVTFGSGGHSRAILERDPQCQVIAFDWDMEAIERFAPPMLEQYGDRFSVIWGNFAHLYKLAKKEQIAQVDGILADFGTSQVQLLHKEGFSFAHNTPLDMRMSPAHYKLTAAIVVNDFSEDKLRNLLFQLGQESYARQIAQEIVRERQKHPITTTGQLAELISRVKPRLPGHRIHPATKTFQALRMHVNQELENITSFLSAAVELLAPQGRLVCISFHSLEDRLVKHFLRDQEHEGRLKVLTKKVVTASKQELAVNRSARSALLRAAERI